MAAEGGCVLCSPGLALILSPQSGILKASQSLVREARESAADTRGVRESLGWLVAPPGVGPVSHEPEKRSGFVGKM